MENNKLSNNDKFGLLLGTLTTLYVVYVIGWLLINW